MKGVIAGICPHARVVDITHEIAPQNLHAAHYVIQTFVPYFPPGTIHVVVVDPGVGSARRPLLLTTPLACFVGPDNGIFSAVWHDALARWSPAKVQARELDNPRYWLPDVSHTFHGRDIFSPVAAHLAAGVAPDDLGTPRDTMVLLPPQTAAWEPFPTRLVGQVVHTDHFGNAITSITSDLLHQMGPGTDTGVHVHVSVETAPADTPLLFPLHATYADVQPGEPLALIGSSGRLELSVRNGNASGTFGIGVGVRVVVDTADTPR